MLFKYMKAVIFPSRFTQENLRVPLIASHVVPVYSGFAFAALKSLDKSTHTTKSSPCYLSFSAWRMI